MRFDDCLYWADEPRKGARVLSESNSMVSVVSAWSSPDTGQRGVSSQVGASPALRPASFFERQRSYGCAKHSFFEPVGGRPGCHAFPRVRVSLQTRGLVPSLKCKSAPAPGTKGLCSAKTLATGVQSGPIDALRDISPAPRLRSVSSHTRGRLLGRSPTNGETK